MPDFHVKSEVAGRVLQIEVAVGNLVAKDGEVALIESMKMEVAVVASASGRVSRILVQPDQMIEAGQTIVVLETGERSL